jgi:type IV secretion system protein VirB10
MPYVFVLALILLAGCKEDEGASPSQVSTQQTQEIAKGFYDYELPREEPPPPPLPPEPEPDPEPMAEDITFPDSRPLMREDRARGLRGLRQWKVNQALASKDMPEVKHDAPKLVDEDYQQWEDASFEESRSTLPVDRSRILTADMRIPGILEDAVNSQVGGRMIVLVKRDVLSPNGRFILLPAYTKIICHYEPLEEVGQSRLAVKCSRLIRPDGLSVALQEATAADQAGRTGLIGDVDNRLWERYGAAFMVAGISALTQAGSNLTKNQVLNSSSNQLSQNIGQIRGSKPEAQKFLRGAFARS